MNTPAAACYVILLGAPGAGKGTQALTLSELTHIPHLASGDVFRSIRQEDSELGPLVRSFYDRGLLVPDEVTIRLILSVLSRDVFGHGALLDGFPRTLEQARALDEALAEEAKCISRVLYIKVSQDELLNRLAGRWLCRRCGAVYHERNRPPRAAGACDLCGGELYQRVDDTIETGRTRLAAYFKETGPLVDWYGEQGKLCEVDGNQPVEAVGRDLLKCLRQDIS